MNDGDLVKAPYPAKPVLRDGRGAFFGPAAEETGGVLQQDGSPLFYGNFVGAKD